MGATKLEAFKEKNDNIDARLQNIIKLVFHFKMSFKKLLLLVVLAIKYCHFLSSMSFKVTHRILGTYTASKS